MNASAEERPPNGPLTVTRCRSCKALVIWAVAVRKDGSVGKKLMVNADPENPGYPLIVPNGNLIFTGQTCGDGRTPIVRYVPKDTIGRHVTHFATCPNSAKHRKTR